MKVYEGREAGIQRCLMHITVKKTIGWLVYRRPRELGVAHVDITILEKIAHRVLIQVQFWQDQWIHGWGDWVDGTGRWNLYFSNHLWKSKNDSNWKT